MKSTWRLGVLWSLNLLITEAFAYDPPSRWGQATVVVNDALFVFGGKLDQFNQFSYTSAPNTNDILYLSLSSPFSADSPPWELVSTSSNSSTSQGPALAWSTLSALNRSDVLHFGGQPDANSDIVLVGESDSAALIDVMNRMNPQWRLDDRTSLKNQPGRRIRHSTVTLPSGRVLIFGGERADGSQTCLSDNWVYDPATSSFSEISSDSGPPALCGQASVPLPDGRVLVFGGYRSSNDSLLDLSIIYVLNISRTGYTWNRLEVASGSLPRPRRAFAAAVIGTNKILIHGGSDASFQTTFDDGWVLDLSQTPAVWTQIDALSELGPRRDHFAVAQGTNVVFGFGWGASSPAPAAIHVFDTDSNTWVSSYTPRPSPATPTLPSPPTATASESGSLSSTSKSHGETTSSPHPTDPDGTSKPGDGDGSMSDDDRRRTAAIAASTTIGALALFIVVAGAFYYRRHRHRRFWDERRFVPVSADSQGGDDDSQLHRNIPRVGGFYDEKDGRLHGLAGIIRGATLKSRNPREAPERRNMLDDEDADFGEWYDRRRRDGSQGSSWSLMSFFGRKSRDPSITGRSTTSSTPWREKNDPFSDVVDEEIGAGVPGTAMRPKTRREASYVSTRSALSYTSYTDPFQDPVTEERRNGSETSYQGDAVRLVNTRLPPLTTLRTNLPLEHVGHALSPLTEGTSQSTLPIGDTTSASSSDNVSRFSTVASRTTSFTSQSDAPRSPTLLSNILPAPTERPIHRSGSWWARLSRRRSNSGSLHPTYTALRDPNPPPKLVTIDESIHSHSPDKESPGSKRSSPGGPTPALQDLPQGNHGKSMSSLRTTDTEAIERIAGTMDVVQRVKSESQHRRSSTDSTGDASIGTAGSSTHTGRSGSELGYSGRDTVASPTEMEAYESIVIPPRSHSPSAAPPISLYNHLSTSTAGMSPTSPTSPTIARPQPGAQSGAVAARIQAYERQRAEEHNVSNSDRPSKRVSVDYGLVPRRSLFVANPDIRRSTDSS